MELAIILAREVAVMFLFVFVGVVCRKGGILNEQAARAISNLVLMVVLPSLLFHSFQRGRVQGALPGLAAVMVLTVLLHLVAIAVAGRAFRGRGDADGNWRIARVATVFSNCAFMGFPLLRATLGEESILYGVMLCGVFNVINWAWSPYTLTGERSFSPGNLLRAPVVIGFLAGLGCYLLGFQLPYLPATLLEQISAMNTPLSMLVIGVFLASVDAREALRDASVYKTVLLRNILLPLAFIAAVWAFQLPAWLPGGKMVAMAVIIPMACPCASLAILMPARHGLDGAYGAKLVAASTLSSIVTLPLVALLADWVI